MEDVQGPKWGCGVVIPESPPKALSSVPSWSCVSVQWSQGDVHRVSSLVNVWCQVPHDRLIHLDTYSPCEWYHELLCDLPGEFLIFNFSRRYLVNTPKLLAFIMILSANFFKSPALVIQLESGLFVSSPNPDVMIDQLIKILPGSIEKRSKLFHIYLAVKWFGSKENDLWLPDSINILGIDTNRKTVESTAFQHVMSLPVPTEVQNREVISDLKIKNGSVI